MPVNLELKIEINDKDAVIQHLGSIRAEFKGELNQTDVYYSFINGLLKLRLENGTQSLIKYLRNENEGERWSDYRIISLSRDDAREYFKDILEEEAVVEKKRLLYLYDNTRIHIDDVKGLGSFLELETLVLNGKEDAEKRFETIAGLLALNRVNEIRKSYRDLILEKQSK